MGETSMEDFLKLAADFERAWENLRVVNGDFSILCTMDGRIQIPARAFRLICGNVPWELAKHSDTVQARATVDVGGLKVRFCTVFTS